ARRVPVRAEHHVLDDQLAPAREQVGQGDLAVRAFEDVLLVQLDHGEPAPVRVERVALPGVLLLPGQQPDPGLAPLLAGHDVGKTHQETSWRRDDDDPSPGWTSRGARTNRTLAGLSLPVLDAEPA